MVFSTRSTIAAHSLIAHCHLAACPFACSDELMAGARLHQIGDYKLAWVEGLVGPPADGSEVSCACSQERVRSSVGSSGCIILAHT